ncbi:MAG: DUF5655 domain-containing protein [Bdellovibrionota bacterium]
MEEKLFGGRKEKWLPLYRRLVARLDRQSGVEIRYLRKSLQILATKSDLPALGMIAVTARGLEVGFTLPTSLLRSTRLLPSRKSPKRITHRVLISEARQIDDELMAWMKMALLTARNAKARST